MKFLLNKMKMIMIIKIKMGNIIMKIKSSIKLNNKNKVLIIKDNQSRMKNMITSKILKKYMKKIMMVIQ